MSFDWLFPIGVESSLVVIAHFGIILATIYISTVGAQRILEETILGVTLLLAPILILLMSFTVIVATVNAAASITLFAQWAIIFIEIVLLVMFWQAVRNPEQH